MLALARSYNQLLRVQKGNVGLIDPFTHSRERLHYAATTSDSGRLVGRPETAIFADYFRMA